MKPSTIFDVADGVTSHQLNNPGNRLPRFPPYPSKYCFPRNSIKRGSQKAIMQKSERLPFKTIFTYYLIYLKDRLKQRETDPQTTETSYSLLHSSHTLYSWSWARKKLEEGNSILVCYVGGRTQLLSQHLPPPREHEQ